MKQIISIAIIATLTFLTISCTNQVDTRAKNQVDKNDIKKQLVTATHSQKTDFHLSKLVSSPSTQNEVLAGAAVEMFLGNYADQPHQQDLKKRPTPDMNKIGGSADLQIINGSNEHDFETLLSISSSRH